MSYRGHCSGEASGDVGDCRRTSAVWVLVLGVIRRRTGLVRAGAGGRGVETERVNL